MIKKILTSIAMSWILISTAGAATELQSAQKLASMSVIKSGSTAADFGLSNTITRKEMMKIVMNLSGKNVPDTCSGSFGDVTSDWGCKYIETALKNGFIAANPNFRPNDTISRAESMKLILKAKGIDKAYNTSDWQGDYMRTALDNGIISAAYSNHTTSALRGWIFSVAAVEKGWASGEKEWASTKKGWTTVAAPTPNSTPAVEAVETAETNSTSGYLDYDASLIWTNDTTVLFFHASWCPSCRTLDDDISAQPSIDNILILKTDYDTQTDLKKKYWVTTQHTIVQINSEWEMIAKWAGGTTFNSTLDDLE